MEREQKRKLNKSKQKSLLNIKKSKIIVLRAMEKNSWVWKGISKKDQSYKQEPLVLDFEGKNFYFYSTNIEKKNYQYKNKISQPYSKLDYFQQEQLLNCFAKETDHKSWSYWTLLKMKVDFLDTITNVLSENLYKKSSLSASEFNNLKDKFLSQYESLMTEIKADVDDNLNINQFKSSIIRDLKKKRGKLYSKFQKLIKKLKAKNINFLQQTVDEDDKKNELIEKDSQFQQLIFNTKKQKNIKFQSILLKNMPKSSWIWKGESEKDQDSLEEPAVLDFQGKNFYFYLSEIEKKDYRSNYRGFQIYKDLNYFQQEQLLNRFTKQTNQEDWYKSILSKMKVDFLDTMADILSENLDKNDNNTIFEFNNLKDKFLSQYKSFMTEIKADVDIKINRLDSDGFISLKKKKGKAYYKFENLVKKLEAKKSIFLVPTVAENFKSQSIEEDSQVQKLIFNPKRKNKIKFQIILLKNVKKNSWVWKGINEKDQSSLEEPAVLEFEGKNFYFYSNNIEKKDYRYNNKFYQLYNTLDYFHQQELLNGFVKQINQKDWYKSILLKMKTEFLDTMADILSENLDKNNSTIAEFNNLKDQFLSQYETLMTEIEAAVDDIKPNSFDRDGVITLKRKKGKLYDKFEKLVKELKAKNITFLVSTVDEGDRRDELLSNITQSNNFDSLINNMITDDKYEKYLDNNFLFDLEQEFDSPTLKKRKLNDSEPKNLLSSTSSKNLLDTENFLNLAVTSLDSTENIQKNFDSNSQNNLDQRNKPEIIQDIDLTEGQKLLEMLEQEEQKQQKEQERQQAKASAVEQRIAIAIEANKRVDLLEQIKEWDQWETDYRFKAFKRQKIQEEELENNELEL